MRLGLEPSLPTLPLHPSLNLSSHEEEPCWFHIEAQLGLPPAHPKMSLSNPTSTTNMGIGSEWSFNIFSQEELQHAIRPSILRGDCIKCGEMNKPQPVTHTVLFCTGYQGPFFPNREKTRSQLMLHKPLVYGALFTVDS